MGLMAAGLGQPPAVFLQLLVCEPVLPGQGLPQVNEQMPALVTSLPTSKEAGCLHKAAEALGSTEQSQLPP